MTPEDSQESANELSGDSELQSIATNWNLYFPSDQFDPTLVWVGVVKLFISFFDATQGGEGSHLLEKYDLEVVSEVFFDYEIFCSALPESLQDFPGVLKNNARTTLACLGLSICSLRKQPMQQDENGLAVMLRRINVRFLNFSPSTPIRRLNASIMGQLVSLKGNVVRVTGVTPLVQCMDFECKKCGEFISKDMPDGKYEPPLYCENSECKSKQFKPDYASAATVDFQRIKLQEIDEGEAGSLEPSRVPGTVQVELSEELVGLVVPGDVVTVIGIVKALNAESINGRGSRQKGRGKESSLLTLLVEANSIENGTNNNNNSDPSRSKTEEENTENAKSDIVANLNEKDFRMIERVATKPNCFKLLVHSLCPMIFGHELVKAGILLALAGGANSNSTRSAKGSTLSTRSDAHVLIVGEPGLGKSQLLQAAAAVAPRGVYVCGNTTSTSGLTVALVKDSRGDFSIEAGALVLADKGVCCIDEFDKMTSEHAALLETMEQQSISIAKAGIVCTLCARTSIIAAANPISGNYNRCRTIQENLKMGAPLLSRFDLVYILLDNPDARDDMLAEHVLRIHKRGDSSQSSQRNPFGGYMPQPHEQEEAEWDTTRPLSQRLRHNGQYKDPLPQAMLRKYIAYARHYCHPMLSRAACATLQSFYLKLRQSGSHEDSTPITTRQLESLIRLAKARAKLELREIVTEQDAKDVVSLLEESLADIYTDQFGVVDLGRSSGMSKGNQKKQLIDRLHKVANQRHSALFTMAELKEVATTMGIEVGPDFYDFIQSLNDQCYFLKKPGGYLLQQNAFTQASQRGGGPL